MRLAARTWLIAAALLGYGPDPAPAQRYTFRYYGHQEGLTNLAIHCLLQDRAGFIWIGTQNGLFRYDGRRFAAFRRADGLPASRIEIAARIGRWDAVGGNAVGFGTALR